MRCAAASARPRSSRSSWRSCWPTPRTDFRASTPSRASSPNRGTCRCRRSGFSARASTARRSRPFWVSGSRSRAIEPRGAPSTRSRGTATFSSLDRADPRARVILATSAICADTTARTRPGGVDGARGDPAARRADPPRCRPRRTRLPTTTTTWSSTRSAAIGAARSSGPRMRCATSWPSSCARPGRTS